jgi:hypothetical protein
MQPAAQRINRISAASSHFSSVLLRAQVSLTHIRAWHCHGFVGFSLFV